GVIGTGANAEAPSSMITALWVVNTLSSLASIWGSWAVAVRIVVTTHGNRRCSVVHASSTDCRIWLGTSGNGWEVGTVAAAAFSLVSGYDFEVIGGAPGAARTASTTSCSRRELRVSGTVG